MFYYYFETAKLGRILNWLSENWPNPIEFCSLQTNYSKNTIKFVTLFPAMPKINTKNKQTFNMTGLEIKWTLGRNNDNK